MNTWRFLPVARLMILVTLVIVAKAGNAANIIQQLQQTAIQQKLSETSQWRALLHYHETISGHIESQVDDERFFLSAEGKTNPQAELLATIEAFANNASAKQKQCQFPARYYWLNKQLKLQQAGIAASQCQEFDAWRQEINPGSVSLIFPAAYLNGPSSMFGHTLLRLNPADHRSQTPLAAYALNYAADSATEDNSVEYLYKGLFGGYPGKFDIVPYYAKIKEYSDIESRDIWEFDLNLTQQEVDQLMRHTWEVKNIVFDYYFFSENCSYRLLTLLDAVRPATGVTNGFDYKAIPADTVKAVRDAGFVSKHYFRPSNTTILMSRQSQLSASELLLAKRIASGEINVNHDQVNQLNKKSRARVIEMAYDLSRIRARHEYDEDKKIAKQSFALLKARSEVNVKDLWDEVPEPEARDDQGHDTDRVAVVVMATEDNPFLSLYYRPAFHDVLDPLNGYRLGSQINFFDFHFRYDVENENLVLQQFKIIDVLSLTPRSDLFKPLSWSFSLGTEYRDISVDKSNVLYSEFTGGLSYSWFKQDVFTIALAAELDLNHNMRKGYSAGSGYQLSYLFDLGNSAGFIKYRSLDFTGGETATIDTLSWRQSLHINANNSLRLGVIRHKRSDIYSNEVEVAWHSYF